MSRQLILALNTEMAEKYYFTISFYKLYINFYLYAPLFTEFELRKVFEKLNGDRVSNNKNINKVHNLPSHASYTAQGQGQTTPRGKNFSININFLSICLFPVSFTHLIAFYHFSPFKCIGDLS